jgi:rod shape-determining protein MreD
VREPDFLPLRRFEAPARAAWLAPVTIMLGSLVTILPFVATVALMPPFGLLMLLGWRMRRPDALKPWAAVLLGMFDDLVSGQPLGSAMLLWTLCFIVIDVLDTRLVWRDFWQDWLLASGAIGFCLIAGRLAATQFGAHVDTVLLLQIIISAALYPLIARLCARLDREKRA